MTKETQVPLNHGSIFNFVRALVVTNDRSSHVEEKIHMTALHYQASSSVEWLTYLISHIAFCEASKYRAQFPYLPCATIPTMLV